MMRAQRVGSLVFFLDFLWTVAQMRWFGREAAFLYFLICKSSPPSALYLIYPPYLSISLLFFTRLGSNWQCVYLYFFYSFRFCEGWWSAFAAPQNGSVDGASKSNIYMRKRQHRCNADCQDCFYSNPWALRSTAPPDRRSLLGNLD